MLIFDEEWNRSDLWKKSALKWWNSAISEQIRKLVPVHLWSGTGTADPVAKRYRYRSQSVPVPPSRTELVPVPAARVFVIFVYLS